MNPNYKGKWVTEDLQNKIWERNNERERLKRKGKRATGEEWKNKLIQLMTKYGTRRLPRHVKTRLDKTIAQMWTEEKG